MQSVHEVVHPLIGRHLTVLRSETTRPAEFRSSVRRLATLLAYEATKDLSTRTAEVKTPVADADRNPFRSVVHGPGGGPPSVTTHRADGSAFQTITMDWTPDGIIIERQGPGDDAEVEGWILDETAADLVPDAEHQLSIRLDPWKAAVDGTVRLEVDRVEIHRWCDGS